MNKTHLVFTIIIIVATILMPACRSTKHITGTQTQTTSISQMEIDSATSRLMTTHRKTTSKHLGSGPNCIVFQKSRQYDVMLI